MKKEVFGLWALFLGLYFVLRLFLRKFGSTQIVTPINFKTKDQDLRSSSKD